MSEENFDRRFVKVLTSIALAIAVFFTIALPSIYYLTANRVIHAELTTQAEINARIAGQIVRVNPKFWRYQIANLQELLARRPGHGSPEIRRIVDVNGTIVTEMADDIAPPLVWHSAAIIDAGVKIAEIRIARSMTPILLRTAGFALLGLMIGLGIFTAMRLLPIRRLRRALAENTQLITELKRREGELSRANDELHQREVELQRSNQELEQFAYVASHDLQEPLRMVTSYAKLLEKRYRGKLDETAGEFIGYIVDGGIRMHRLLQDLLKYSRVGTQGKEFAWVNCQDVFDNCLQNLTVAIDESHANITHDGLPILLGDDVQLSQLLQNLLGNAIKYRANRAPEVHLSCVRRDDLWEFAIPDNGIGIDTEFLDRIFVIFQRLHTSEDYEGTGIGLAVCKKIVERHGGRIWVESVKGQGSIFYFTLPAHSPTEHASAAPSIALENVAL